MYLLAAATESPIVTNLVVGLVLGSLAYWLGWRLRIPSILLLLLAGLIAGPGLQLANPDQLLGPALFPLVSAAVAVILFEGGLSLKLRDLREAAQPIWRITFVGFGISWVLTSLLAWQYLEFRPALAALFGALMSVTGPTVIGPMLRTIRLPARLKNTAKWEGILIDPIGVLAAVFAYDAFLAGGLEEAPKVFLLGIAQTLGISLLLGGLAAALLTAAVKARKAPEFLHNQLVLSLILVVFFASDAVQTESGLVTVTIFGVLLVNQRIFRVEHIIHFKENLRTLFITGLFLVLAARVDRETIQLIKLDSLLFVGALIFLVRPAAVWLSLIGSSMAWRDRVMLMFLAPRGIIATALTSVFALRLSDQGAPEAEPMLAITLLVVVGTVSFYGLTAPIAARQLRLTNPRPNGLLMVGAHSWARYLARTLIEAGAKVRLIDNNPFNVNAALDENLPATLGNVLSEEFIEEIDMSNVGWAICLTANNEINTFARTTLTAFIERTHIFRLTPEVAEGEAQPVMPLNPLFDLHVTYPWMARQINRGARFKMISLTSEVKASEVSGILGRNCLPLCSVAPGGELYIFAKHDKARRYPRETLVYLELADDINETVADPEPE
ncbi:MAG: cation:proton antiporter [Opitutales bacterium]